MAKKAHAGAGAIVSRSSAGSHPTANVVPPAQPGHPGGLTNAEVESTLRHWDSYILRQAARIARAHTGSGDDADDFAQAARIALATRFSKSSELDELALKRIIAAAVKDAARRERRRLRAGSPQRVEFCDATHGSPVTQPSDRVEAVREFASLLPIRLQTLYQLLYAHGYTQCEVAQIMRISQPRVSQLDRVLKERARTVLARFAA